MLGEIFDDNFEYTDGFRVLSFPLIHIDEDLHSDGSFMSFLCNTSGNAKALLYSFSECLVLQSKCGSLLAERSVTKCQVSHDPIYHDVFSPRKISKPFFKVFPGRKKAPARLP